MNVFYYFVYVNLGIFIIYEIIRSYTCYKQYNFKELIRKNPMKTEICDENGMFIYEKPYKICYIYLYFRIIN